MNPRPLISLLCAGLVAQPLLADDSRPNILLICIDDLRPELPAFGKSYIHAPTIEKLADEGRLFKHHYVQSPTCGASRYALLTGIAPTSKKLLNNSALTHHDHEKFPTFPSLLRKNGYHTVAVGKISHYPGGFMGENWADKSKPEVPNAWDYSPDPSGIWKNPQTQMHGVGNGKARIKGEAPAAESKQESYPDDPTVALSQKILVDLKSEQKPWLCAIGLLRPHLPFACPKKYLDIYNSKELPPIPNNTKPNLNAGEFWHKSSELFNGYSNEADPREDGAYATKLRKHYAACVSYADDNVAKILKTLEDSGHANNTIIILWGDHGWHLGEHKIWGKHSPYHVALHSPLIIKIPQQSKPGVDSDQIVETVDIYPTICDLTNVEKPQQLQGKSMVKLIQDPNAKSDGIAKAHWRGQVTTITSGKVEITDKKTGKLMQQYQIQ